jgi:hypothetical protein
MVDSNLVGYQMEVLLEEEEEAEEAVVAVEPMQLNHLFHQTRRYK